MARKKVAELLIRLLDQVSGPAKKAQAGLEGLQASAAKLDKLDKSVLSETSKSLEKAAAAAKAMSHAMLDVDWSGKFQKDLLKLKATPAEFVKIRKSWNDLQRDLQHPGRARGALTTLEAQTRFERQQLWELIALRAAKQRHIEDMSRVRGAASRTGRLIAGAAGVYVGAHGAGRAGRATAQAAGVVEREKARDYLGGLGTNDTLALQTAGRSMSDRFKSIDAATMHSLLRESALSMGGVDKAIAIAEPLARSLVTLQSLKGKDSALSQLTGFIRALDTLGKNQDPKEISALLDGATRAAGVQGAEYNPADLWTTAKTAKSAGFSLSQHFLSRILPTVIADAGPSRPGTAMGSAVAQLIGGRATKEAKAYQQGLGLRDKKGNFPTRDLFASDPFLWATTVFKPALAKKGIDTSNNAAVTEAANKAFSNQNVSWLLGYFITQQAQIEKTIAALDRAPGLKAAEELPTRDPFVAAEGALAQLRNAAAALAEPAVPAATAALNAFAGAMGTISKKLHDDPLLAKSAGTVATSAATGAGIVGTIRAAGALWNGGGVNGALAGLLRGGVRGGILGSIAGTAWLAYEAATTGKATADVIGQSASGKNYTPRDAEGVFGLAEQLGQLETQIQGVKDRTHPSRVGEPNADLSRLEGEAQEVRNRITAGTAGMGDGLVKSLADGIVAGSQTAVQAMDTLMESLRARARTGVQVPVTIAPGAGAGTVPGTPPGRASGGRVYAGQLYQVNESRQEFFEPDVNGTVNNGRPSSGASASTPITPNVSVTANVSVAGTQFDFEELVSATMTKIEAEFRSSLRGLAADYGMEATG